MSLEDFHTKALRLVKEEEYLEGDTQNRVLRDTIISGLASDKIWANIIKEGKDVTLARVMEIAQLEVSTQGHIDGMQETAKVNYVHYGKASKNKPRPSGSSGSSAPVAPVAAAESTLDTLESPLERQESSTTTDICWRCWKGRHQKGQHCKAVEAVYRNCGTKGYYEKVCMKKSTLLVNIPGTSTNSEPDYFNEHWDPVYTFTHMVHVKETNQNKHLIQFPISTDFKKVRNSQDCSIVLLKADTSVDVNLMNSSTFDRVIVDRSALQLTSLRTETYGNNTTVEVLERFHTFLRWKCKIYRPLFYVTNPNTSPNLLSRDGYYTLGMVQPCYSVETSGSSSKFQAKPKQNPHSLQLTWDQTQMHGNSTQHLSDEGTGEEKLSHSTQKSLYKEPL